MTTSRVAERPHPADGVLLALIDEERDEGRRAELADAAQHVADCDECQRRLAAIDAASNLVRRALASIPVPIGGETVLRRRVERAVAQRAVPMWWRPAWQAAAAGLVLAGVAAASPIRLWLFRHRESVRADIGSQPSAAPTPNAQPTTPPPDRSAIVSFAPSGREFTMRFDSLPAGGTLTAESTTAAEISARALNGASADPLVVLPGALRVRNASASRASYVVSLPNAVIHLRVIVAGDTIFDAAPPAVIRLDRRR